MRLPFILIVIGLLVTISLVILAAEAKATSTFFFDDVEDSSLDLTDNELRWVIDDSRWFQVKPTDFSRGTAHSGQKAYYFTRTPEGDEYEPGCDTGMATPDEFDRDGDGTEYDLDDAIDLRTAKYPQLQFYYKHDLGTGDQFLVQVSTTYQSGSSPDEDNWQTLSGGTFTGTTSGWPNSWHNQTINLSAWSGEQIWLQFRLMANSDSDVGEGVLLDDISVTGEDYNDNIGARIGDNEVWEAGTPNTLNILVINNGINNQDDVTIEAQVVDGEDEKVWPMDGDWEEETIDIEDEAVIIDQWSIGDDLENGTYTVRVSVHLKDDPNDEQDENPDNNYQELEVYLNAIPTASIDGIEPSPANTGDQINFTGSGDDIDGSVVSYFWQSSIDGYLSTASSFSSSSLSNGDHTISFNVQDDLGSWSSMVTTTLHVNSIPTATIETVSPTQATEGSDVFFEGSGIDIDGTITSYQWRSNVDAELSNSASFSTTELSVGDHIISFRVQDNEVAWSSWKSTNLHVNGKPTAFIDSITPSSSNSGQNVIFEGFGNDDKIVAGYQWQSDRDGLLSDQATFTINTLSAGNHTILFRVKDDDNVWSNWVNTTIYVYIAPEAIINFISPSPAEKGAAVTLNGTGTDADGTIVAYKWSSSVDGNLGTGWHLTISNLSLGTHIITFQVQDNDGVWSSDTTTLIVFAKPVAIVGDTTTILPGASVQFSGAGTDEDGSIVKYEWDFNGDGVYEWSSDQNGVTTFIYNNEGTYTAMLRVTDDDGYSSEASRVIIVKKAGGDDDDDSDAPQFVSIFIIILISSFFINVTYRR